MYWFSFYSKKKRIEELEIENRMLKLKLKQMEYYSDELLKHSNGLIIAGTQLQIISNAIRPLENENNAST